MRNLSLLLTLCCGLTLPTSAWSASITAGIVDGFALPADLASASAALRTSLPGSYVDFDVVAQNSQVGHTFDLSSSEIASLTLEIRLRAGDGGRCKSVPGCTNWTENDWLLIGFADDVLETFWKRDIGTTPGLSDGLILSAWVPGSDTTLILDLASLPLAGGGTTNLLPLLNERGFLDVVVSDESAVDYMKLTMETLQAVPEPTTSLLLALGLAGMAAWKRTRSS